MQNNKKNQKVQKNQKKAPKEMQSVIIVDVQYDFANPSGALYVNGGEKTVPAIISYVEKNKDKINQKQRFSGYD